MKPLSTLSLEIRRATRRAGVLAGLFAALAPLALAGAQGGDSPGAKDLVEITTPLADIPQPRKVALVVGVGKYDNTSSLNYTVKDANDFAQHLKRKLGFADDGVVVLTDDATNPDDRPTYTRVRKAFRTLVAGLSDSSIVMVFYSGHGVRDSSQDWLVPRDGDPSDIGGTCISATDFLNKLPEKSPRRALVFFDACRNMARGKDINPTQFGQDSADPKASEVAVMYSCKAGEVSQEANPKDEIKQGVFTHYLLRGLSGDQAAVDDRGNITFDTLHPYVRAGVGQYVKKWYEAVQTPIGLCTGGKMVLVRAVGQRSVDVKQLLKQAVLLVFDEKLEDAAKIAREVLQMQADNPQAHQILGKFHFEQKQYDLAIQECQMALQLNSNTPYAREVLDAAMKMKAMPGTGLLPTGPRFAWRSPAGHLLLAAACTDRARYAEAAAEYREALRLSPGLGPARDGLAAVLEAQGRAEARRRVEEASRLLLRGELAAAEGQARAAVASDPRSPQARFLLGQCRVARRGYDEGSALFREALRLDPGFGSARQGLQWAAARRRQDEAALLVATATDLLLRGRTGEAVTAARRALDQDERNADAHRVLARAYARQGRLALAARERRASARPRTRLAAAALEPGWLLCQDGADVKRLIREGQQLLEDDLYTQAEARAREALQADPNSADALFFLGRVQFRVKKYDAAIESYQQVVKAQANYPLAQEYLSGAMKARDQAEAKRLLQDASGFFVRNRMEEAEAAARQSLARDGSNPQTYVVLGGAQLARKQYDQAIASYQKALELDPTLFAARDQLDLARNAKQIGEASRLAVGAAELLAGGNAARAQAQAQEALRQNPRDARAHAVLGQVYLAAKQYDPAIQEFQEALRLQPGDAGAAAGLKQAIMARGNDTADQLVEQATRLLGLKSLPEAEARAREAVARDPANARAWSVLGDSQQARASQSEAVRSYREALRLQPGLPSAATGLAAALQKRGVAYAAGLVQEAYQLLTRDESLDAIVRARAALVENPDSADAYAILGYGLLITGQNPDEARRSIGRALQLNPDSALAHVAEGSRLYFKEDYKGAARELERALQLDEKLVLALNNLGAAYARQKKLDEAVRVTATAVRLDETYAYPYANLGSYHFQRKKYREAEESYRRAIELEPRNGTFRAWLAYTMLALQQKDLARQYAQEAVNLGIMSHPVFKELKLKVGADGMLVPR